MSNYSKRNDRDRWEVKSSDVKTWIKEGFEPDTINYTEKFGEFLVQARLTTSQIRNIFNEVKRIQAIVLQQNGLASVRKDFLMLRPKLAYAAKRAGNRGIESLREVLDTAHQAVELEGETSKKTFNNFVDFFESILAYHKAKGGSE